jgi:hypothetical protein
MSRLMHAVRFSGADLDYAAWHAHLAAHPTPARLLFLRPRQGGSATQPTGERRAEPLDLATWRARLAGVERRAA